MSRTNRATVKHFRELTWDLISKTTELQKDPLFDYVLADEQQVAKLFSNASISFAPDLMAMLQSPDPPTVVDFETKLPTHHELVWAVYLLVLEKGNENKEDKPKVYIGSGTEVRYGVKVRLADYIHGTTLPKKVQDAEGAGYGITHQGLLCWSSIPPAGNDKDVSLMFKTRVLYTALEAALSLELWGMNSLDEKKYDMPISCAWDVSKLEYDGLCTHVSIIERVRGLEKAFSAEEREVIRRKRAELSEARRLGREARYRDTGKKAATALGVARRAIETERYTCYVCPRNPRCKDRHALRKHNHTGKHRTGLDRLASKLARMCRNRTRSREKRMGLMWATASKVTGCRVEAWSEDEDKIRCTLARLVEVATVQAGKGVEGKEGSDEAKAGRVLVDLVECAKAIADPLEEAQARNAQKSAGRRANAIQSGRYCCEVCLQRFGQRCGLTAHMGRHEREQERAIVRTLKHVLIPVRGRQMVEQRC